MPAKLSDRRLDGRLSVRNRKVARRVEPLALITIKVSPKLFNLASVRRRQRNLHLCFNEDFIRILLIILRPRKKGYVTLLLTSLLRRKLKTGISNSR